MTEENGKAVSTAGSRLPLLPKKRSSNPFHRLEELATVGDPPQDLRLQAQRDPRSTDIGEPPVAPSAAAGADAPLPMEAPRRPEQEAASSSKTVVEKPEHMVLQTTVPIDKAQAFKMHCIRNRTTVREELRRLVDQVVSTQPGDG